MEKVTLYYIRVYGINDIKIEKWVDEEEKKLYEREKAYLEVLKKIELPRR